MIEEALKILNELDYEGKEESVDDIEQIYNFLLAPSDSGQPKALELFEKLAGMLANSVKGMLFYKKLSEEHDTELTLLQDKFNKAQDERFGISSEKTAVVEKQMAADGDTGTQNASEEKTGKKPTKKELQEKARQEELQRKADQKELQKQADQSRKGNVQVSSYTRKPKSTLEERIANMPHREYRPEADERVILDGVEMELAGYRYVRTVVNHVPETLEAVDVYEPMYVRADLPKKLISQRVPLPGAVPPPLIPGSVLTPSLAALLVSNKFEFSLPMNRQIPMMNRAGFTVTPATLDNWMIKLDKLYLAPVWDHLVMYMRGTHVIHIDETTWQVLGIPGKLNTSESRCFGYCTGRYEPYRIVVLDFKPDRCGENAVAMLTGFVGCALTDGYNGYGKLSGSVIRCACWSHARRYWKKAIPSLAAPAGAAYKGFDYCNRMFALDSQWDDLTADERREQRQLHLKPLMDEFFDWVRGLKPIKGSSLARAVTYCLNLETELRQCLEHGDVDLDNNAIERCFKLFAVGRGNWLFNGSPAGADAAAHIFSLVETAKRNDLDVYAYFCYVLDKARRFGPKPTAEQLDSLMPWSEEVQKAARKAS